MNKYLISVVLMLLWSATISAAVPTSADEQIIQQKAEEILRQERLRDAEKLKDQDLRRRPPTTIELDIEKEGEPGEPSKQCFEINEIILEDAHSLSAEEKQKLVKPFLGKCIGMTEIKELLRTITNYYIDKGYVTTRVYIPQQELDNGVLKLLVIEGISESINQESEDAGINIATAFPGLTGKVYNIRDFEQGLDQINRLQSNNASLDLQPGSTPGKTRVVIRNKPASPLSGSFVVDDYGSESTGENRGTATANIDNLLGLNDFWSLGYTRNLDGNSTRLSVSKLLSFNVPYGYWTLSGSYSDYEYKSLLKGVAVSFNTSGVSDTSNLGLSRVLRRGQDYKLTLSSGLTYKDTKNYIEGSLLETSSRKDTALDVNLTSVSSGLGGTWTIDGGVTRGLHWFGSEELISTSPTAPKAAFWKFNLGATYSRPFKLGERHASWSSSVKAQYANDYLFGSEQTSVGGLYTVRGFDGTSIAGDRGIYMRNDFLVTMSRPANKTLARVFGSLQPYMALDVGKIYKRTGQQGGTLAGVAIGIRNSAGLATLDLGYGVPIDYPDYLDVGTGVENHAVYVRLGISI